MLFLIEVLTKIARQIEHEQEEFSRTEQRLHAQRIEALVNQPPPLPNFSYFHRYFAPGQPSGTPEGKMRAAYYLAYNEDNCDYIRIDDPALDESLASGKELVSASFVTPYPPGFPILVPGQVISDDIIAFMRELDITEIHGYRPTWGLKIFTDTALEKVGREMGTL